MCVVPSPLLRRPYRLLCSDRHGPVRRCAFACVESTYFENLTTLIIVASSVILALDSPQAELNPRNRHMLGIAEIVFCVLFASEAAVKIYAYGFVRLGAAQQTGRPYLREKWNIVDFAVSALGIIDLCLTNVSLRWIRILRILRPLRLINRFVELRIVVQAMWSSFVNVSNIIIVAALYFIMFAVIGVGLFMGRLHYCDARHGADGLPLMDPADLPGGGFPPKVTREACLALGGANGTTVWRNSPDNFDNIGNAIATLFQMSTGQDWATVMYRGVDAAGKNEGPATDNNLWVCVYFMARGGGNDAAPSVFVPQRASHPRRGFELE